LGKKHKPQRDLESKQRNAHGSETEDWVRSQNTPRPRGCTGCKVSYAPLGNQTSQGSTGMIALTIRCLQDKCGEKNANETGLTKPDELPSG